MTTSGKHSRFARRSLPTAGLLIPLFLVLWTAVAAAQPGPGLAAGLFEIDGNLLSEDPSHVDWFAGILGPNAGVIDPDSCRGQVQHLGAFLDAAFYRDDHWAGNALDLSTLGAAKNDDCIDPDVAPWNLESGSGPGKSDITEAYSASYKDPATGDVWLLLGFATRSTNGSSEMDFEFNAEGLTVDSSGETIYGTGPDCGRTIGDFIVSINFLSGGAVAQPEVHVWDGVQFASLDTTTPPGEQPRFLVALNDSIAPAPCGAVSPDGVMAVEYLPLQFAEIAVNLSALGVDLADYCGRPASTLGFKTRSSTSFTSSLKDIKLFPFQLVPSTKASITGDLELCADESTQLCGPEFDMAGNPLTYRWSTGETGRCIELSAASLGEGEHAVSLVVSNTFGCVDSTAVLLRVNPEVVASVADVAVCAGETGVLTASVSQGSAPFTYAWSTGESGSSITVGVSGEYCVTVTDANGCQTQACGTFTVHDAVVVAVANQAACAGETGTLRAEITSGGTAPFTYAWSNGETSESIVVGEAGEYSVEVTDANGCIGTASAMLTVHPVVAITVPDVAVCFGEEATLRCVASSGTAPFQIEWSTGSTAETLRVSEAGEYSVVVTDANGCVGTAQGTVTVHSPVQVRVGDLEICSGETGTLQAAVSSGTAPYSFAWSTGATGPTLAVGTAGEYSVVVTDANGCVGTAQGTLTVHPVLEVSVADAAVCSGETGTLSASLANGTSPFTYAWSTGESGPSITVGASGEYCVTVTDANGCSGRACATFTVRSELAVELDDLTVCSGESGTFAVRVADGTAPYTYVWSTGATSASITAGEAGEYCVTVTDANGCEGRACATLAVRAPLKVVLGDVETCAGEPVTLSSGVQNGNGPFSYHWSTGERGESITVTESGEYCLRVTDDNGCEGEACATVTVLPAIEVRVADAMACAGELGTLKAEVEGGTGPFTFAWSTGSTRDRIEVGEAGDYGVIVTDAKGCRAEASGTLSLHSELIARVDDVEVCEGDEGTLVARIEGGTAPYSCSWSTGETTPSITNGRMGEYCVTVTDANGCEVQACGMLLQAAMPVCEIQGPSWVCLSEAATFFVALEAGPSIGSVAATGGAVPMQAPRPVKLSAESLLELTPAGFSEPLGADPANRVVGKVTPGLDDTASIQMRWSVSDPAAVEFLTPADAPEIQLRFKAVGRYVLRLEVTSSAGCKSQCEMEIVALDCDAGSCPRTVGFWGRQCAQSGNGDTKYGIKQMYRIIECVDDHSLALDFRGGPRGFEDFCEVIDTDDMNQRTQAYRQYAGMLANICVGNLGFVASNGDSVRLFETTPIHFPGFESRTIGELVVEMDDLLLSLVGRSLDDAEVKSLYTKIIRVADAINNAKGIGRTCFGGDGEPPVENKDDDGPIVTSAFKPAPNPFAGETTILYTIAGAKAIPVRITVYDIAGRRVRTLESGMREPGRRMAVWNGQDEHGIQAARGVYYIRANLGEQKFTSRVVLLR